MDECARLLRTNRLGLTEGDVFFNSTREEKIERIANLRCTDFIDDLEETFLKKLSRDNHAYPVRTRKRISGASRRAVDEYLEGDQ